MRLLLVLFLALCSDAMIVDYAGVLEGGTLDWFLVGMYKTQAYLPPGVVAAGVGASFIDVNVTVGRAGIALAGHVEVLIFHEEDLAYIGIHGPYQMFLCCDKEVMNARGCTSEFLGFTGLTTPVKLRNDIFYKLLPFDASQDAVSFATRYYVQRDGLYYIIFVNCNEKVTCLSLAFFSWLKWKL
jgi:hypothetical protein